MSAATGGRWRSGAGIAVVASSVLVLVAVRWASDRAEHALARRVAGATARYLALVAPPSRGSADYDLPRLLIETRALDGRLEGQLFMDLAGRPGLYNAAAVRKELAAEVPYFAGLGAGVAELGVKLGV